MHPKRTIFLIDGQSFYASVEKAAHPEYKNRPVAVAGDPARRSGIILAACPLAKARGVTTAERLGEALGKCPELVIIRPRMQTYITVSLLITEIFESFTELVEPFSIDEQFLDVTHSINHFGSPEEIARQIQTRVMLSTGVWSRVGIGPTKILAKTATDNFSKKRNDGVFWLGADNLEDEYWPLHVSKMFMVASRMANHFVNMGLSTIGGIARMPLGEFKKRMRQKMGRQSDIQAEYYWQTANGIDPSPVVALTRPEQKAIGHGMTLPYDYRKFEEIEVVLLELAEEVCRRSRSKGYQGRVLTVGCQGADFDRPTGFYRQMTLPDPTNITHDIAIAARRLFQEHWNGLPVRKLAINLTQLSDDSTYQLTLFDDREKLRKVEKATDGIKNRFGSASIVKASSLLRSGQASERAIKIGGHYK
ncbi:DNA polymerase IV [Cohnella silvisoli]|uniref:DNA polymerase IV n=1 Tax=Cohnella silvisoli TaxID=2873699 RepID=A0ABV1KUV5_9BACL|nr:DNA polymerase IV [Cohnella silvisoli]MCD9023286.1 DNA polymerase IV [Cohnella silvisoli]